MDRVYDGLEQVRQAHDDMEHDRATGKLVVRVRHRRPLHPGKVQHGDSQVVVHLAAELLVLPAQAGMDSGAIGVASGDLDAQLPLADPVRSSQPGAD